MSLVAKHLEPAVEPETWAPVVGFAGRYDVSTLGRVWSRVTNRELAGAPTSRGYLSVVLYDGSKPKNGTSFTVHSLVAIAFRGQRPKDKPEIDHKDGNKLNNRLSNLEYVTSRENNLRANRTGLATHAKGCESHNAKLTADQVRYIRHHEYRRGLYRQLAREFGMSPDAIAFIHKGKRYQNVT